MTVWRKSRAAAIGIAAAFALALTSGSDVWAHHSLSLFDSSETFKVQGRVTRVDWRNPHCFFYIAVTEPSGIAGEWKLESAPESSGLWTVSRYDRQKAVRPQQESGKSPQPNADDCNSKSR
jgi:hypothetical protein